MSQKEGDKKRVLIKLAERMGKICMRARKWGSETKEKLCRNVDFPAFWSPMIK